MCIHIYPDVFKALWLIIFRLRNSRNRARARECVYVYVLARVRRHNMHILIKKNVRSGVVKWTSLYEFG